MLILRFMGAALVLTVGAAFAIYLATNDRRWFRFAVQSFKVGFLIIFILLCLFALERWAVAI